MATLDAARRLRETLPMSVGSLAFVGRGAELDELRAGIAGALTGRGGLWLLTGEPGIGKSRLAEELVRAAGDRVTALWGRCSEAGGAPAYWPWIQILRALLRRGGGAVPGDRAVAQLVQLLPELRGTRDFSEPPALAPDQARFALMDALTGVLCDAAAERPLLLVLEDLHAADSSSLAVLEFLLNQVRGASIAAVGTYRDAEAQDCEALLRIAREARVVPLRRLGPDDVDRYVGAVLGGSVPADVSAAVYARTEGNPLFVVELARLLLSRGDAAHAAIPTTIRSAVRRRLDCLSPEARDVLELAAVFGREFRVAELADAFERDALALAEPLVEACRAAIIDADGTGRYRFSHILVRDHIYDEISADRRVSAHARIGRALQMGGAAPATVAHHFLAAGDDRAVDAAVAAARAAAAQWALEDAVEWYRRALDALAGRGDDPRRIAAIRLGLAEAEMYAGSVAAGRAECRRVAAIARELGDGELLARSALACGSVLVFANVDARLISLLEEARDALPPGDSDLRARVLARLAAALQPAEDPTGPIALAREAIAMARRCGDAATRLATLRAGCSAMMDMVDPRERVDLNLEHAQLAVELGDLAESIRGHTRLAFDRFELGDMAGMRAAISVVDRTSSQLGHPYYRWRVLLFGASLALWEGRLDDAEALLGEAEQHSTSDPNAAIAGRFCRAELACLRGEAERVFAEVNGMFGPLDGTPLGGHATAVLSCEMLARLGRAGEIPARRDAPAVAYMLNSGDRSSWPALAEIASATGDRELAAAVRDRLRSAIDQMNTTGVIGMTLSTPIAHTLAVVELVIGDSAAALRHFEIACDRARRLGGRTVTPRVELDHAHALLRHGDRGRAAALAEAAGAAIEELGLWGMRAKLDEVRAELAGPALSSPAPAREPAASVSLRREGELWAIQGSAGVIRLPDMKGLHVIAQLIAEPGREFHALDLSGASGDGAIDRGDAGEMLDEQARREYQRRLRELDDDIARAEEWNDTSRAAAAREERELLTAELSRAVGLAGRVRRSGSAAERARINVQRRVAAAIKKIAEQDPALGRQLERSILTGTFCSYEPA